MGIFLLPELGRAEMGTVAFFLCGEGEGVREVEPAIVEEEEE